MAGTAFELAAPGRIVFGAGASKQVVSALQALGAKRVLLVAGKSPERAKRHLTGVPIVATHAIPSEPTLAMVDDGRALATRERCDAVIAFGGGSAVDAGKAIAALAHSDGALLDHLEVVGKAQPLPSPGLPCIAIPTTAGTGAEVTKNSVLASPEAKVKASLRSAFLLPSLALVDPDLLDGIPSAVLATTGMDALSHLLESFVSLRANAFTIALAKEGMARIAQSLRPAFAHGLTPERREDLALASLFGGLCLANSGLGAVHGFAAPLGGMWKTPHGAVCAALLPAVMRTNVAALSARAPDDPALARYRALDRVLAQGTDAAAWTSETSALLGIPGLADMGVGEGDVALLVEKGKRASSMRGNPIVLTDAELAHIVVASMRGAA
jgi:alcohol dehydrogenase class IV